MNPSQAGYIVPSQRTRKQQRAHDAYAGQLPEFQLNAFHHRNQRTVFSDVVNKEFGKHLPTLEQNIGSCVGHGAQNVATYRHPHELFTLTQSEQFFIPYIPYHYGCGRMIGDRRHQIQWGNDPSGSFGSIQFEALNELGVISCFQAYQYDSTLPMPRLRKDRHGETLVWPGKADAQWALPPYVPEALLEIGRTQTMKGISRIRDADNLRQAICAFYPCTIAWMFDLSQRTKNRGGKTFTRRANRVGGHQVAVIGYDLDPEPCFLIANSWSADFYGPQLDGPPGSVWITHREINEILLQRDTECFAFGEITGIQDMPSDPWNWTQPASLEYAESELFHRRILQLDE